MAGPGRDWLNRAVPAIASLSLGAYRFAEFLSAFIPRQLRLKRFNGPETTCSSPPFGIGAAVIALFGPLHSEALQAAD